MASCLSRLQGALPSTVMLEGNSPALPQQRFWAGPAAKPTTTADRCLCHQASVNIESHVADRYLKKSTMSLGHPQAL